MGILELVQENYGADHGSHLLCRQRMRASKEQGWDKELCNDQPTTSSRELNQQQVKEWRRLDLPATAISTQLQKCLRKCEVETNRTNPTLLMYWPCVFKGTKVKIEELTSGGGNIQSARGFLILFCQQMSILLQMKQLWWLKNVKTHLLNAVICCQTCQL